MLRSALEQGKKKIADLFYSVDTDHSQSISLPELQTMFAKMQQRVSPDEVSEIFASIDVDNSGSITMPEFIADFNNTTSMDVDMLIRQEHEKRNEQRMMGGDQYSDAERKNLQQQTRMEMVQAEKQMLKRMLSTKASLLSTAESTN